MASGSESITIGSFHVVDPDETIANEKSPKKTVSIEYDELHKEEDNISDDVQSEEPQPESIPQNPILSAIMGEDQAPEGEISDEVNDEKLKVKKPEESREARRERLKNARNIRFVVDEPTVPIGSPVGCESQDEPTAISTPTRASIANDFEMRTDQGEEVDDEPAETESVADEMEEGTIDELLNMDDDEEEDIEDRIIKPSRQVDSVQAKKIFLDDFEIPSVSDISEDFDDHRLSTMKLKESTVSMQPVAKEDKGRFVDPLTGLSVTSSSSSSTTEVSQPSEEDFAQLAPIDEKDRLDKFDELAAIKTTVVIAPDNEDVFGKFTREFLTPTIAFDAHEYEEKMRQHQQTLKITLDFMDDLIYMVVKEVEDEKRESRFKHQLDKRKLILKLIEARDSYLYERDVNTFLNARMCDYYKRGRNTRPFATLPKSSEAREYTRYKQALFTYDYHINAMAKTKTKSSYLLGSVMMDLSYIDNIGRQSEEHLELVMLSILGKRSDYLYRVTERELKLMREKRNELSDTRRFLITRKHTLGRIKEKLAKLEKINDELVMDDFISIQNQVTAINKKIEERNVELKRLRFTYHSELHIAQHNRERSIAMASKLKEHSRKLSKKLEIQRSLRERLYNAKMERSRLRKKHVDLTYQGGLLAMPALMHDYDETVEKVRTKQALVQEMKETIARLTQRIADYNTHCL
ncbi:uncharacterized protein LOC132786351 [Drosophila nasuta]|uniref:uncharacterized protein LOC132786351 n=1 Tax=Drosophila nasuta TaxID=42062 RepID=UPI00295E9A8A|nr:uncharacterized protein LOC132786351 [Drosophila nasuta]